MNAQHTPGPWFTMKCLGQPIWTVGRYVLDAKHGRALQTLASGRNPNRDAEFLSEEAAFRAADKRNAKAAGSAS